MRMNRNNLVLGAIILFGCIVCCERPACQKSDAGAMQIADRYQIFNFFLQEGETCSMEDEAILVPLLDKVSAFRQENLNRGTTCSDVRPSATVAVCQIVQLRRGAEGGFVEVRSIPMTYKYFSARDMEVLRGLSATKRSVQKLSSYFEKLENEGTVAPTRNEVDPENRK